MADIIASEFLDPDGLIVKSGERLARRALELLREGHSPVISLRGLSGISSSYFNIFLRTVLDASGPDALGRITFEFVSPLQRQVYERSVDAVLKLPTTQDR